MSNAGDGGQLTPSRPGPVTGSDARRIEILRAVAAAGGTLNPTRHPDAVLGYEFSTLESGADDDLRYLAQRDYLNEKFYDRVSACPKCSSHHLNIRKVCPTCHSAHIVSEPLIHHFRCGFVGRLSEFETADAGKRVCPKCATQLRYVGTDHDFIGKTYVCQNCHASFQDPPSSAVCLNCSTETPENQLLDLEVVGYALTSLGMSVLRRGTLFEQETEFLYVAGLRVYRPTVLIELLGHEARRAARYKTSLSLMIVRFPPTRDPEMDAAIRDRILDQFRQRLRDTDLLGQFSDQIYIACLGDTPLKGGQVAKTRILRQIKDQEIGIEIEIAEVKSMDALQELFAKLAAES